MIAKNQCWHGSPIWSCEICALMEELNALKIQPGPPEFVESADALAKIVKELTVTTHGTHDWKGNPTSDTYTIDRHKLVRLFDALAAYEKIRELK